MGDFDDESWGKRYMYWSKDVDDGSTCEPVDWPTEYHMASIYDYQRCVCDLHVYDMEEWEDCYVSHS